MLVFDKARRLGCGEGVPILRGDDTAYLRLNTSQYALLPGFCDVHVHLREPGFSYKETIQSGTRAAARGGFTALCSMPNLDPVPDCPAHLEAQEAIIARDACIPVYPYGAVTVGEKGEALA